MRDAGRAKRIEECKAVCCFSASMTLRRMGLPAAGIPAAAWLVGRSLADARPVQDAFGGPLAQIPMAPGLALAVACGAALLASALILSRALAEAGARHARAASPDAAALACERRAPRSAPDGCAAPIARPAVCRRARGRGLSHWARRASRGFLEVLPAAGSGGVCAMAWGAIVRLAAWAQAAEGAFGGPLAMPDLAPALIWCGQWTCVIVFALALASWAAGWSADALDEQDDLLGIPRDL